MNNIENSSIAQRIEILSRFLKYCDERYFLYNTPILDDKDYDLLVEELENLKKKNQENELNENNNQLFADLRDDSYKITHKQPMLSLQKVYEMKEIYNFFEKSNKDLLLEMKIDGMSISIHYNYGIFSHAITRGDGNIGEDISIHIFQITDIPLILKIPDSYPFKDLIKNSSIEIRGELFIKKTTHRKYFPNNIHPRNICSGLIRKKYPDKMTGYINFFAYSIIGIKEIKNQFDILYNLNKLSFPVEKNYLLIQDKIKLEQTLEYWRHNLQFLDYECDGVVLKINDINLYESFGNTATHPRGAIAFKFANKYKSTFLKSIDWQVGINGTITPVGNINPVEIDGVIIKKVTLHNCDFLKNLNSNNIIVERAGGVIPKVIKISNEDLKKYGFLENKINVEIPKFCPDCKSELIESEKNLLCPNYKLCKSQIIGRLISFLQKLSIKGIGEKQMKILVENKIINGYSDILSLPNAFKNSPHEDISPIIWEKFLKQISKIYEKKKILQAITISYGGKKTMEKITDIIIKNPIILSYSPERIQEYFLLNDYFTKKIALIIAQSIYNFSDEILKILQN